MRNSLSIAREELCVQRAHTQRAHKTPLSHAHSELLWLKAGGNCGGIGRNGPAAHRGELAANMRALKDLPPKSYRRPAPDGHIVLRITKRPTPTTGPNRVATTIMTNDLPTITQTPHTHCLRRRGNAPTQSLIQHANTDRPIPDRTCILYYANSFHTFYSQFGHILISPLRNDRAVGKKQQSSNLGGRRRFLNKFLKIQIPDRGADTPHERDESGRRSRK
jgi:hypothetical protein